MLSTQEPPVYVTDPFTGEHEPVERAVSPDVAILHAQAVDDAGNIFIEDPTTDILMAGAARRVLATAEKRVARLSRAPEDSQIPGQCFGRSILSAR